MREVFLRSAKVDDSRLPRRREVLPPCRHTVALGNDLHQPSVTSDPDFERLRRLQPEFFAKKSPVVNPVNDVQFAK